MSVEERIAKLERSNRIWKRVNVSLFVMLIGVGLLGANNFQQNLTVRSLTLINGAGQERAKLEIDNSSGAGVFSLLDSQGDYLSFYTNSQGGVQNLRGTETNGTRGVMTTHFNSGAPQISFFPRSSSEARIHSMHTSSSQQAGTILFRPNVGIVHQ